MESTIREKQVLEDLTSNYLALRFVNNAVAKRKRTRKLTGPLTTVEMENASNLWVKKVQGSTLPNLQAPGWELVKDNANILRCKGRIPGYSPINVEGGLFGERLIAHTDQPIMHLGVANTMANIRDEWWISRPRSKVKKVINQCNTCKVFSTRPYGSEATAEMPSFRTEGGRPLETSRVHFTGPLDYKITKKERGKCYVLMFTCATSRAVHLEVAKSPMVEEFQRTHLLPERQGLVSPFQTTPQYSRLLQAR